MVLSYAIVFQVFFNLYVFFFIQQSERRDLGDRHSEFIEFCFKLQGIFTKEFSLNSLE